MMNDKRTLKRLSIALLVLIIGLIIFLLIHTMGKRTEYSLPEEYAAPQKELPQIVEKPETVAPVVEEKKEDPFEKKVPERYVVGKHTVKEDESFSLVTGIYWDDVYLWPDLYIRNEMKSEDPDIIYPEEIIEIYNRLGNGDLYDEVEKDEILKAYIEVYDVYKKLGPAKDNSVWALLYSGAKYDHDFLQIFSDRIDPADKAMAQKYIDEEGYLD